MYAVLSKYEKQNIEKEVKYDLVHIYGIKFILILTLNYSEHSSQANI